ncbi:hypothetical protein ACFLZX_05505 [Nanoarchaeota archaeon]
MEQITLFHVGIGIIFIGMFVIILSTLQGQSDSKVSFVGILGFIPFGFSNDKKLLIMSFGILAIIVLGYFLYFRQSAP